MRNDDVLARLRASDPILGADPSRADRGALDDLRDGIMLTDRGEPARGTRRRVLGRGGVVAVAAAALVLGGGVSYATYQRLYVSDSTGVTCLTRWVDPATGPQEGENGPDLTGDPVADCRLYREQAGRPAIPDPVAFRFKEEVYVAPRSQVPSSATLLNPATPQDAAVRELEGGFSDWVDGLYSRCFSETEAVAFAKTQIKRLGLTGWRIEVLPADSRDDDQPCADADLDPGHNTVIVLPHRLRDHSVRNAGTVDPFVYELRDALVEGVSSRCVGLRQAEQVTRRALGTQHHWPLTVLPDSTASCTRADLQVGGSIQVTLRGPEVANP
ncbi:hypothetical protein ACIBCT_05835 [Streptosporangium sp. NPDC050855]|uniref:hypothetical protein n=1 Tax=Streptosporangium sp. NPDC050855 TaxID=3366194 RepID=UPI0037B5244B